MNNLGDMVVAITGDTSNFNISIDAAGKKLDVLTQVIAKSAVDMSSSFKKIDNEAKLWGNSTDLITQKQKALKDEMTNLMNQGFDPMSAKVQSLKTQYSALGDEALALEKSQISLKNNLKEFGSLMTGLGVGLTASVTIPIIGMAKAAVESSAQMEMLQASFTTFLGNADQAKSLMTDLIQMAAKTPFVTTDLASGAKLLLQYGIATQDVIPDLKMLGDVSSGNTEIFNRLVYAFGQINSTGRLMGQDLRQMTEAGFNPLYIISQKTGESIQSLQKRMAAGGVSAGEVTEAFKIATSEGGKFYQGMERGSLTFTGLVSTLKDNIGIMGRSITDQFIPGLKEIIKSLSGMAQWLTALDPSTKSFIVVMGAFAVAAGPVALGIGLISSAIATMDVATKSLMLTTAPVILAIGAVIALVALIGTKAAESKKQLDDLSTATFKIGTSDPAILNNALVEVNKQIQAQKDLIGLAKMRKESLAAVPDLEKKLADLEQTRIGISSTLFQVLKKGENANLTDVQTSIVKEDEWITKREAAEASLTHEYALIDEKQKAAYISGEAYDAQSEKRKVLLETLNKMLEQGFTVQGAGYQTILQANLDVMVGGEARYEALNRMDDEYAGSQIENDAKIVEAENAKNAKIVEAENAKNAVLNQKGQIYINRQKEMAIAANKASADESAITVSNNNKINEIYNRSYTTFESIELNKGILINQLGVEDVAATQWASDQKSKIWANGLSMVSGTMDQITSIISSSNEMSIQSFTKLGSSIASQFGPTGTLISGILNVIGSIFGALDAIKKKREQDDVNNLNNSLANTKNNIDAETQAELIAAGLENETAVQLAQDKVDAAKDALNGVLDTYDTQKKAINDLYNTELTAINSTYDAKKKSLDDLENAELASLDKQQQAELYAAGLTGPATEQQYKEQIAIATRSGDRNKVLSLQQALDTLLINQKYDALKTTAQTQHDADVLELNAKHDADLLALEKTKNDAITKIENQQVLDTAQRELEKAEIVEKGEQRKQLAIAQTAIAVAQATGQSIDSINALIDAYNLLPGATQIHHAAPLPGPALATPTVSSGGGERLASGGIVMPRLGGVPVTVAEAGQPEIIIPLNQLYRFTSGTSSNDEIGTISLVVNLDSKPFLDTIFKATKNKTVLISQGAVV